MRLSEWRATAPAREAVTPKVTAVVDPVLSSFGAEPDPDCWIAWGEEPANRFAIFVPTEPGLIACFVRVNVAGEGPRATTKLVRWARVSIGELGMETQAGHRMISFQLESQVLRGVDGEADRAAAFALRVIAAIDGRTLPPVGGAGRKVAGRGRNVAPTGGGRATKSTPTPAAAARSTGSGSAPKAAGRATAGPKGISNANR
jgi:hypothetical protein